MIVVVVDTNVLRYALEAEKDLRSDEETKTAYEVLAKLLENDFVVIVVNKETAEEYYRHLETLKIRLKQARIVPPSFGLLRKIMSKLKKVPVENHDV